MLRFLIFIIDRTLKFLSLQSSKVQSRTAIISLHKIGDSVFTIPALRLLCAKSSGEIRVFCYPDTKEIYAAALPGIKCSVIGREEVFLRRLAKPGARKKLKAFSPAIIYDFTGTILSASLAAGIQAEIYGLTSKPYDIIYKNWIPRRKNPHLMDVFFDAIAVNKVISVTEINKEFPVIRDGKSKVLIHPFAGWPAKEWGFNKFVTLLQELENHGYDCELLVEKERVTECKDFTKNKLSVTSDMQELISKIKECGAFIGNDSGPLYIANFLGKPTFTIYGPTNPDFSIPYGDAHSFIRLEIHCSPAKGEQYCYTDAGRKGCASFECMNKLQVNETINKVLFFLQMNKISVRQKAC